MPFNIPSHDADRFSFGPGILFIGAVGSTPTTDVGAVRTGAELVINRTVLEARQGSQMNLIRQYVTTENVQLTVNGIEWNIVRLAEALGAGVTTSSGGLDTLEFGGDINMAEVALSFVHQMPSGATVTVDLWEASPAGEFSINFGEDLHEFPYSFKALDSDTRWDGTAILGNQRLLRITHSQ